MDKNDILAIDKIIKVGDDLYIFSRVLPALYKINSRTGEMVQICVPKNYAYRAIFGVAEGILFFPSCRGDVCFFEYNTGCLRYIAMPEGLHKENEQNWSARYVVFEDSLFFFWQNSVITKYNYKKNEWKAYRDWSENYYKDANYKHWLNTGFVLNEKIYFWVGDSNKILLFDTCKDEFSTMELVIPPQVNKILSIYFMKNVLWLVSFENENRIGIYQYREENYDNYREIGTIPIRSQEQLYHIAIGGNDEKLWLLPWHNEYPYLANGYDSQIIKLDGIPSYDVTQISDSRILRCNYEYGESIGNEYYSFNVISGELICINMDTEKLQITNTHLSDNNYKKSFLNFVSENNDVIIENDYMNLQSLLWAYS